MFDGLNFGIDGENCKRLVSGSDVLLIGEHDHNTRIPFQRAKGRYKGFYVKVVSENRALFRGSIHKYGNATNGLGTLNGDQFNYHSCTKAILSLSDLLKMEPNDIELKKLEAGLNIVSPLITATEYIDRAISVRGSVFTDFDNIGRQLAKSEMRFKYYHKGKQTKSRAEDTLRVELASLKMRGWGGVPIHTLGDLLNREIWFKTFERLEWWLQGLVFAPRIDQCQNLEVLRPSSLEFLKQMAHRDYLAKLPTSKSRRDAIKRLADLSSTLGLPDLKAILLAEAQRTFLALIEEKSVVSHIGESREKIVVSHPLDNIGKNANSPSLSSGPPPLAPPPSPLPELDVDQDQQQVEADSEARPLPACKVCLNPIEGRGKGAKTCGPACKLTADARARATRRHRAKCGNVDGVLFEDSA